MAHTYIELDAYLRKWIFNHQDLPVTAEDKTNIWPLTQASAMEVWNKWISNKSSYAEQFTKGDWPAKTNAWTKTDDWQSAWDSDNCGLPEMLAEFIHWPNDTQVYFCYDKYQIIESRWDVFARNWKCFLFFDDGPILIAPKQKQAVMFEQNGQYKLGVRG